MKLVLNPEKPQGADIEGNFGGLIVSLPAGSEAHLPESIVIELHDRYPWLVVVEGEAVSADAKEKAPETASAETAPIVPDEKARKAALIEALKAKGITARSNMKLDKLEALASEHGVA